MNADIRTGGNTMNRDFPLAYACINKDNQVRKKSSSGGIFYLLAKYVFMHDGIICAARYDLDWNVVHSICESLDDIESFMGSKYVQSRLGEIYKTIRELLKTGTLIMFVGTPCQVAGLKSFLRKEYSTLILVDLVCHGVPSPVIWKKYLEEQAQGKHIEKISFRSKRDGWLKFSPKISYSDGSTFQEVQCRDPFLHGFMQNLYLRPSCFECSFKGLERESDLTLGDFWGIQKLDLNMFDDKGTSLVLIQSKKGLTIWNEISHQLKTKEFDTEEAVKENSAIFMSVKPHKNRDKFFKEYRYKGIIRAEHTCTKVSLQLKVMCKIRKLFKKAID